MVKIKDLYKEGIKILEENEIETPKTDARVILEYVLKTDSGKLPLYYKEEASSLIREEYLSLIEKRKNHMPCSYITKTKEFMSLLFKVDEGVLIPRCETENLCEYAINRIGENSFKVADICTGSGCIGLSVKNYCKNISADLFDISDFCVKIAEENRENLDLKDVRVIKKDILNEELLGVYDVILSNPPYIPKQDIPFLMEEVRDYEPECALTDNDDGYIFYKRLAFLSEKYLKKGGFMAVEVGINMYSEVEKIFGKYGKTEIIYDDFGIERIVVLNKE